MKEKKEKAAPTPNGSDGHNTENKDNYKKPTGKEIPAQFDEAWVKKDTRQIWLVKWDITGTGHHCILESTVKGKNPKQIAKYLGAVLRKYDIRQIYGLDGDFRSYFKQRVKERGRVCLN